MASSTSKVRILYKDLVKSHKSTEYGKTMVKRKKRYGQIQAIRTKTEQYDDPQPKSRCKLRYPIKISSYCCFCDTHGAIHSQNLIF